VTPVPKAPDIALEKHKALRAAEEKALAEAARAEANALKLARDKQLAEQKRRELLRQMEQDELLQRMAEETAASELRQAREAEARLAQRGLWTGGFEPPAHWRDGR